MKFTHPLTQMTPRLACGLTLVVALLSVAGPSAQAQIVTNSLPFSFGYGATSKGTVCFTTTETAAFNMATNLGAFGFVPAVTGTWFSSAGPKFTDRVLTNGDGSFQRVTADSGSFGISITGTYTGLIPSNYFAVISLNITSLVVRGISETTFGASTAKWNETTPGQSQSSTNVSLYLATNSNTEWENAANYRLLSWNPNDFYTTNAVSQTRTFTVTAVNSINAVGLDGLEVFGTVDVIFLTIPEPSTALLLVSSLPILWWVRRRRS